MASTENTVTVTKDHLKITVAGYQLKICKVEEEYENFEEFLKNLEFKD